MRSIKAKGISLTLASTVLVTLLIVLRFTPSSAQTTIPIGVDAYANHISSEPAGLTYVYKYIVPGGQNIVSNYISTAYANGKKPVLVVYTNYDSTTPNWSTWDGTMNAIRQDGREVDVVVEPDLFGYIKNQNACGTTGRQMVDRFLSTAPSNANLGFFISPWMLPYTTPQADAASWKSCWQAAGGERMADIYVDVTDRDQEYKGTYPWPVSKLQMYETWFKELSNATGRKIGVWQIPLGNSQCSNGRRSTFVENWLVQSKLTELSPYVDKLLFGPGIEDYDAANTQSWNLPQHVKYECGMFNSRVNSLSGGSPPPTSPPATQTSAPPTVAPTRTSTPVPPAPTATRTSVPPGPTATQTPVPPGPTATSTPSGGGSTTLIQAESMYLPSGRGQAYSSNACNGGRALLIWSNASASTTVTLPKGTSTMMVRASGDQCNGPPHMVISVDGVRVLSRNVTSTSWLYSWAQASVAAGNHTVTVTFDNDYYGACDRNLRIDMLAFW